MFSINSRGQRQFRYSNLGSPIVIARVCVCVCVCVRVRVRSADEFDCVQSERDAFRRFI